MTKTWYVLKIPGSEEYFYNHSDGTYYTTLTSNIERAERYSSPKYADSARMRPHAYNYSWELVQITMEITQQQIKMLKSISNEQWYKYCEKWDY